MRKVSAETRKEKLLNVLVRDWAGSADAEALSRYLGAFVDGDFVRFAAATPESVDRLKFSPFRVVLRLHGRQEVIVKLYRRSGSRPRREADGLDRARRLGLPCPEPLAWQDARGSGRDPGFLIIRDLGAGRALDATLESALDSAADPAARARAVELCHEAGELIARACRVGLVHRDLHLGNVFVDQADKPWLLDLHGARFKDRPTVPRLADFMPLYLSIPWPEQAAFRQALFVELGLPATPGRLPDWLLKHLDKRVHRCLRDSGTFLRQGRSARRLGFAGSAETWRSGAASDARRGGG
ncbi:MAG: lipopolysaccharide kinase InaA family protein, partial [Planctomycetota bacterium]